MPWIIQVRKGTAWKKLFECKDRFEAERRYLLLSTSREVQVEFVEGHASQTGGFPPCSTPERFAQAVRGTRYTTESITP